MADERIIVEFDAEIRQYQEALDEAIDSNEELAKTATKGAKTSEDAYKNAARKRSATIEKEKKLLKELRKNQRLAFDSKTVDQYNRKINESERRLKSLTAVGKKSGSSLRSIFGSVAGGIGVTVAGAAIVGLGKKAIEAASDYETLKVSFNTFLGDAKKGEKVLKELDKFSIKTPFTPEQVQQAGKALLAFGIESDKLTETLGRLGDVSSGTGKDFNELSVIYGKARVQGTLFAEDLNQLTEAGIPIIQEFAEQFGVTEDQVKKLGSEGLITFENLEKGFESLTSEGGKFFNLTAELSQTTAGRFSTLQGKVTELARDIGAKLLPSLNSLLDLFIGTDPLEEAAANFNTASKAVENFNENLEPLLVRYDQLNGKTKEGTKEQEELDEIILKIAKDVPTAISGFDEYGNAIAINTEIARAYGDALEENIRFEKQSLFAEIEKKRAEQTAILNDAVGQLTTTLDGVPVKYKKIGDASDKFARSTVPIKLVGSEILALQQQAEDAEKALIDLQRREDLALGKKIDTDAEDNATKLLQLDVLRTKTVTELNGLKIEQGKIDDRTARQNIVLIDKVLKDLQKTQKERDKIAKEQEKQAKAAADFVKEQRKLDFEAEEEERKEEQKTTEEFFNEIGKRQAAEQKYEREVAAFRNQQRIEARAGDPLTGRVNFAFAELAALEEINRTEVANIDQKVQDGIFSVANGEFQKIEIYRKSVEARANILSTLGITESDLVKTSVGLFLEANEQYIQAGQQLVNEFINLANQNANAAISALESQREFENEVYEERLTELDDLRERREITENDYQRQVAETEKQRLESEERIDKAQKKLRREQAIAQRAQAAFSIILNTATGITAALASVPPNVILSAIIGGIGAAQLAAVLGAPLPAYAKGTKGTPDDEMAIVGEKGPELIWMPRGSKVLHNKGVESNPAMIDAMFDGRLNDYIHQNYVAPELLKASKETQIEREIIVNNTKMAPGSGGSIYYDVLNASIDAGRRGTKIKNVDALAVAIAREISNNQSWQ